MSSKKRERGDKIGKIKVVHPYITEDEAIFALKECDNDEEAVVDFLTDYYNLQVIRKKITQASKKNQETTKKYTVVEKNDDDDEDDDEEKRFKKRKKKNGKEKKNGKDVKERRDKSDYQYRKLRLDDAIAQGSFEGWSPARIKAYQQKDTNPNAYYYRFNDPGEEQRNGPWTKEEVSLFFSRMEEMGVNGQWGIFSRTIPGRVGYQCSNFYRQLIESGQIHDSHYVLDDKGKVHYLFKNKKKQIESENKKKENKKKKR